MIIDCKAYFLIYFKPDGINSADLPEARGRAQYGAARGSARKVKGWAVLAPAAGPYFESGRKTGSRGRVWPASYETPVSAAGSGIPGWAGATSF